MEDVLEEMWKKLSFTEEEDESITLGRGTIEAAKVVGKNCLLMKVLSHKYINIEALRKNMRMLWKPNKGVQINEIGEELFLAEFGDGRDKKRIMDMSPWTYEKQLILLKEFEGEQVPKDIQLRQSPFWVQIHNLPLHCRTRETGWAIGSKLGEVVDVDVTESGVQWGKYLRVRVQLDVTKKLIRGKKIAVEGGEQSWISFKYERLPNFCYKCGMLSHGLKDCPEGKGEALPETSALQYGAWLRGEVPRRWGTEERWPTKGVSMMDRRGEKDMTLHAPGRSLGQGKPLNSALPSVKESVRGDVSTEEGEEGNKQKGDHEKGKETSRGEQPTEVITNLDEENTEGLCDQKLTKEVMQGERGTEPVNEIPFDFHVAPNFDDSRETMGLESGVKDTGPMAMSYDVNMGWVAETLGPRSGHWKRLARKARELSPTEEAKEKTSLGKRSGTSPSKDSEVDSNTLKRRKRQVRSKTQDHNDVRDGGEAVAAEQHRRAS